MTCIAAVVKDKKVYMGGDSAGSDGIIIEGRKDPKVFINGPYLIGYTTSFRMGQILKYTNFDEPDDDDDLMKFMVKRFVSNLHESFDDAGWASKDDGREKGGTFLVGVKGRLFKIETDFHVGETINDYQAVGSGTELALGALYATRSNKRLSPETRIRSALEAATEHCPSVRGPFHILRNA